MACLFLIMCAIAFLVPNNEKLIIFALQSAASLLGCLLTLVTGRRPSASDTLMDPTSTKASVVTTVESETTQTDKKE